MNNIVRNILAFIAGFIAGSIVNLGIIQLGSLVIAPPAGVNVEDLASISAAMDQGLYRLHHFITPFLAHALGTLTGAYVTYWLAASAKNALTWAMGAFFLLGGVFAASVIPAPTWFIVVDLVFAYLPMAWLAIKLGSRRNPVGPEPSGA